MPKTDKYALLGSLLPHLEAYEREAGQEADLRGLGEWLRSKGETNEKAGKAPGSGKEARAIRLSILLTWLYRFAKSYTKKGLEDSPVKNPDDFTFLATLAFRGPMSQSDLAREHLLEVSSAAEVLKRLVRAGWVEKKAHPEDGRIKQYAITPAGQHTYFATQPEMMRVAYIIGGDLSDEQLDLLASLLERLNAFHQKVLDQNRDLDLQRIASTLPLTP